MIIQWFARATNWENESQQSDRWEEWVYSPDVAFPINVGLLHSYFIRPIIIIIKLLLLLN